MEKHKSLLSLFVASLLLLSCQNKETRSSHQDTSHPSAGEFSNEPNKLITGSHQLTFVGPKSGEGYFSPDGKKMIFQSERHAGNPFYQMYVMDLETGKTTEVSTGKGKTTCGWIHPSMKRVLYSSTHLDPETNKKVQDELENRKKAVKARYSWSFDESYDIFASDLNGKNLKQLTKEKGYDAEGSYSPDGQWIAFASNRLGYSEKLTDEDQKLFDQDPSYMMDIYIMKADGTGVKRLTDAKGYDGGPFFSADGKKITWRRFAANGSTAEIYTMNADGSDQKAVTHLKSMSWAPFYHPSGDYIIFGSSVLGYSNFELFIVDAAGKQNPVRVTFDEGFDGLPVFTPDGNQLSWTHRNEKGDSQIMMSKWDDTLARKLLKLPVQDPTAAPMSAEITKADMQKWIRYLASEEMGGRKTGSPEEKIYTAKIAEALKSWGYQGMGPQGSFIESFEFTSGVSLGARNSLELVGAIKRKFAVNGDYQPLSFSKAGEFHEAPIVFVGYGIKAPASDKMPAYNSYQGLDVKGKWVLILNDQPADISTERRQYLNLYSRLQHKVTVAHNEGAVGVLLVHGPNAGPVNKFDDIKFDGGFSETSLAVLKISTDSASSILKKAGQDLKDLEVKLDKGEMVEAVAIPSTYVKANIDLQFKKSQGLNVVAKLPVAGAVTGILVGAHGDHLGHGDVGSSLAKGDEKAHSHLGADDNASGVAGLLELAHYYAHVKKTSPQLVKKNLYFAVWSGEELGTLGSSAFVKSFSKNNGGQDIKKAISAYLNMDMIGRLKDKLFVQGLGSGDNWLSMTEDVAISTGVPLIAQEDPYLPTDSLAIYLAEIPTVALFTGAHGEYHTPRDREELINYDGMLKVMDVAQAYLNPLLSTTYSIVKYKKVEGSNKRMEGRSFRVYLGTIPDYAQEGVKGVRISGASKDSPAEQAGLKEKDIITEFDGMKIENLYDYVYTLQAVKPNKETIMKVQRDGKILELKIIPKLKE